jgi:hypothetical protein
MDTRDGGIGIFFSSPFCPRFLVGEKTLAFSLTRHDINHRHFVPWSSPRFPVTGTRYYSALLMADMTMRQQALKYACFEYR